MCDMCVPALCALCARLGDDSYFEKIAKPLGRVASFFAQVGRFLCTQTYVLLIQLELPLLNKASSSPSVGWRRWDHSQYQKLRVIPLRGETYCSKIISELQYVSPCGGGEQERGPQA